MKTDEQDLVVMEDEAIRQGRVVKSIPEPGTVLIAPTPDFEAGWLASRANPPRVEGFPEAEFKNWWLKNRGENLGPVDIARWGFAQGTLAPQPRQGRLIVEMPLGKRMSVTAFVCKCGFENEVSDMDIVKGVAPQPAPDERKGPFEKFAEFITEGDEPTSSPEALKRLDETIQAQLERARAAAPTEPTREQYENLVHVLEQVRSQMCWERDRDQMTTGMADLHDVVTSALAPFAEKGGS